MIQFPVSPTLERTSSSAPFVRINDQREPKKLILPLLDIIVKGYVKGRWKNSHRPYLRLGPRPITRPRLEPSFRLGLPTLEPPDCASRPRVEPTHEAADPEGRIRKDLQEELFFRFALPILPLCNKKENERRHAVRCSKFNTTAIISQLFLFSCS